MRPKLRLVLTGFGPFPGVPFNASAALVQELVDAPPRGLPRFDIYSAVLPVEWNTAASEARRMFASVEPHLIVHLGVSRRAKGFVIETRAFNLASSRIDQADVRPGSYCLRRGAPPMLRTPLQAGQIAQRLRHAGFPASTSDNPGRYLCNAVYYEALDYCRNAEPQPSALFVHIPVLTGAQIEVVVSEPVAWNTIRAGGLVLLRLAAENARRLRQHQSMGRSNTGKPNS